MLGFLNVNKPRGPSSHAVVEQVRRLVAPDVKVGHAGTLDPFAEGVLVVCLGAATRLAEFVQRQAKRYAARITLGATSATDDITGTITAAPAPPANAPEIGEVSRIVAGFVGQIMQVPPAHSAVLVNGRRAYKLARAGRELKLAARPVNVYSIEVVSYEYPSLEIAVHCGSGTYIRALARDIGAALGVGGYCAALQRTQVGPFTIDTAVRPEDIDPARDLMPPLAGLGELPKIMLEGGALTRFLMGQGVWVDDPTVWGDCDQAAVVGPDGEFAAIGLKVENGSIIRPAKVLPR